MFVARSCRIVFALLALTSTPLLAQAQALVGSGLTYQGKLDASGAPANGLVSMSFSLWNAATNGAQVGSMLHFDGSVGNSPPVNVSDGLFTVELDFGAAAFSGDARWLEITVNGVTLSPRQPLTAAPYAIQTRGIFVNSAGDRVGIGTAAPTHPLHVVGTERNPLLVESSSTVGTWLNLLNTSSGGRFWRLISSGSDNTEGAGHLLIGHGSTAQSHVPVMTLRSNGRVGIGTTAPKQALHNTGDYYGVGHLWLHAFQGDGQSGTAYVQARDNSLVSNIALQLRSQQFGAPRDVVHIAANGNVGIGTTTPEDTLHIASGAIRFADNTRQTTAVRSLRFSGSIDFGSIAANSGATGQFLNIGNAELGATVSMSPDQDLPAGLIVAWVRVSAAGTVRYYLRNVSGAAIDPPLITFYVTVINP